MLNIVQGVWGYLSRNQNGKNIFLLGNHYQGHDEFWGLVEGDYEREAALISAAPQMYTLLSLIAEDQSVSFKYKADVQELVHAIEGKIEKIF